MQGGYPDITPQIRWFIYPLGYAAAARAAQPRKSAVKARASWK